MLSPASREPGPRRKDWWIRPFPASVGSEHVAVKQSGILSPSPFDRVHDRRSNTLWSLRALLVLYVSQVSGAKRMCSRRAQLVNVSTALVDQPIAGVPVAVQVMAKGSLHAVTRALAIEYAKDGIRVNTVALASSKLRCINPRPMSL